MDQMICFCWEFMFFGLPQHSEQLYVEPQRYIGFGYLQKTLYATTLETAEEFTCSNAPVIACQTVLIKVPCVLLCSFI